jgi:hypothetical protein
MIRRLEAGFERLPSDDFDGVSLDPIPCDDATACDIGRDKLNQRRRAVRPVGG